METAKKRLQDVVREECNQFYKYGRRARASDVASLIRSDYPEMIADLSDQLVDRQLRRMCASAMKSWSAVSDTGETQIELPGMEAHMLERLPPAISIPVDGDSQDIEFVPARTALPGEWREHLEYLRKQHKGIGNTIDAIVELLERGADCPDGVPLMQFVGGRQPVEAD